MAKRAKHDPFFVHLWDELTSANILQRPEVQKWLDLPAQVQKQFIEAAKNAMNAALGAPRKAPKKAAKKAPKAKAKAKAKPKAKAKKRG